MLCMLGSIPASDDAGMLTDDLRRHRNRSESPTRLPAPNRQKRDGEMILRATSPHSMTGIFEISNLSLRVR